MKHTEHIASWVAQNSDRITEGLCQIVRFPTVSGATDPESIARFEKAVEEAWQFLQGQAERMGLKFKHLSGGAILLEAGEGEESIGFPLHIDVVPPGTGWRHEDPFSGAVDEEQIWGRGVQDNKGPLMAALHGLEAVLALGEPLRRRVQLIIGAGEEIVEWEDIEAARDEIGAPTLSIVSDSGFPIVTGEKGWVDAIIESQWQLTDTNVKLVSLASGTRPNVVPDHAVATLEGVGEIDWDHLLQSFVDEHPEAQVEIANEGDRVHLETFGKRAHGSSPWKGHNAAHDMIALLLMLDGFDASTKTALRLLQEDCTDPLGAPLGLKGEHEFLGPTTVSLGVLTMEEGSLSATLNIRPAGDIVGQAVIDTVANSLARHELELTVRSRARTFDPFVREESEVGELITALEESWRTVTGAEPTRLPMSGTTYAKVFPRSVGFGPVWSEAEGSFFHQVDERMPVASHLRNVRLMAEAIARLAL